LKQKSKKYILLSFDIEEFDTPLEYGKKLSIEEQMIFSDQGLQVVLKILEKYEIPATFFTTANYANYYPDLIKSLNNSYEVASHGYYHSSFEVKDLLESRIALEKITGKTIHGYRMARMMPVDDKEISKAGYVYNASLHPTFIPGRYNNLDKPRTYFIKEGVLQIQASVTPLIRFPLFWLSFKNFPLSAIKMASQWVINKDHYVNLYFHPWEFIDTTDKEKFGLPFYISDNGIKMNEKLKNYIDWGLSKGYEFCTYYHLYKMIKENKFN